MTRRGARLAALVGPLLVASALAPAAAPPARASPRLQAMFEDDLSLRIDPAGTLARLRMLGVQRVRVAVGWSDVAPRPGASHPPPNFHPADPASYPSANWQIWDQIVIQAQADGIALDLDPMGGAPAWARGPGAPPGNMNSSWRPSPRAYQAFVHALGARYSGRYDPKLERTVVDDNDLPRVSFWSAWNEPNYGPHLAPQGVPGRLTVENSPRMYRNLVDAAWRALHQTGHGHDTFLLGELAPRGFDFWGVFSMMKPVVFLRDLYCLDHRYRPLTGAAAAIRGCPTTPGGRRAFRARNPGLFAASGVSIHPYMRWYPPNREARPDPDYASLAEIGHLTRGLDRIQRAYGSRQRFSIWNTEFGYITTPPKHDNQYEQAKPHYQPWPSQRTAAYYLNWAEYLSYRNPRLASFSQYLLHDPFPSLSSDDWGGFASGLLGYDYSEKPTYSAWRLPVFMPRNSAGRGRRLAVWGGLRPARYAILDTGSPQTVEIQLEPGSRGPFETVQTVTFARADAGSYFTAYVRFPASGTVRLAWTYPVGDPLLGDYATPHTVYSRYIHLILR